MMETLQFVDGYPMDREQRQRTLSAIQTNAARRRWHKIKSVDKGRSAVAIRGRQSGSRKCTSVKREGFARRPDGESDMLSRLECKQNLVGEQPCALFLQNLDTRILPPFVPVQHEESMSHRDLLWMLKNCHNKWQSLFPFEIHNSTKPADFWMRLMINSKEVFETFMFSHFQRLQFDQPSAKHRRLWMEWYGRNMASIRENFQDPKRILDDDNIFAVWTLSLYAPRRDSLVKERDATPRPLQGPLKSLDLVHGVDVVMKFEEIHRRGFLKLLELRGGLQGLEIGVAGYAFCLAEIFYATQNLCRPQIEFVSSLSLDFHASLAANRRQDHPLRQMGCGFLEIQKLNSSPYCQKVVESLQSLALYSLGVDDYSAGRNPRKALGILAQERAFVQHRLMSLFPDGGPIDEAYGAENGIHLCHQAGVIYSLLCVLPIPKAPFSKIVRQLRKQFMEVDCAALWDKAPRLMIWVVVMFAIAAVGMPERAWAVGVLDRCFRRLMIDSWNKLQKVLETFLWLPMTNDCDGKLLWDEIEQSNPFAQERLMLESVY